MEGRILNLRLWQARILGRVNRKMDPEDGRVEELRKVTTPTPPPGPPGRRGSTLDQGRRP